MIARQSHEIAQLDALDPVRCPCGWARRAFADLPDSPTSVHVVDIEIDARTHYHKEHTEVYIILEGAGHLELDGAQVPVQPLLSVLIKPRCRHRAVGKMRILNISIPTFDPDDEWFD
ncbi:MAG: cupin domain-containing protein [Verrucomicrobiota bacterium]|nr:cupin domain-containing protein [Verrucomicrobiota bacterium]